MPRRWTAPAIVLENVQTGDGRVIAPMAVEWADLPLPLAWLRDGDQHVSLTEVAPQIGTIGTMARDGDAIGATGVIDDENPDGAEVIRRMDAGTAPLGSRFPVSVDPDDWEVEIVATDSDEGEVIILAVAGQGPLSAQSLRAAVVTALRAAAGDPDPGEDGGEDGTVLFEDAVDTILERYTRLRLRGATLCSVAAFDGAWIELEAEGAEGAEGAEDAPEAPEDEPEAVAAAVPTAPPSAWFSAAEPEAGDDRLIEQIDGGWAVPLTILDTGQVFGHIARAGQGHRGYSGRRVPPPRSACGYREFHVGHVVCEDGADVATGTLTVGCDHAPLSMSLLGARDHYAHTGMGWADGRVSDGAFGPWFAGALRPGLSAEDLRVLRATTLSGDWRPANGNLELVGVQSVNVPGYPVAREARVASAHLVAAARDTTVGLDREGGLSALVAAGVVARCGECAERRQQEAMAAAAGDSADLRRALDGVVAAVGRIERRTRHLEPIAASALAERVHGG